MLNSCKVLGIENIFSLDETDHRYTRDICEILDSSDQIWNVDRIKEEIKRAVLRKSRKQRNSKDYEALKEKRRLAPAQGERSYGYDYLILMLPDEMQHAHHKLSALIALRAVDEIFGNPDFLRDNPSAKAPIVLAGTEPVYQNFISSPADFYHPFCVVSKSDQPLPAPLSSSTSAPSVFSFTDSGALVFLFDRTQGFGPENKLDYTTIVAWAMAEHKSQGLLFKECFGQKSELYWVVKTKYFNLDKDLLSVLSLFEKLRAEKE